MSGGDLLRMDYINSLPHPFLARFCGDKTWWPVNDFEVQTGFMRIDVCGLLQVKSFGEVMEIEDGEGRRHDPDTFYWETCEHCGVPAPIQDLDAKPQRLAGRRATRRQIKKALRRNEDFDRLECRKCYGPMFEAGVQP